MIGAIHLGLPGPAAAGSGPAAAAPAVPGEATSGAMAFGDVVAWLVGATPAGAASGRGRVRFAGEAEGEVALSAPTTARDGEAGAEAVVVTPSPLPTVVSPLVTPRLGSCAERATPEATDDAIDAAVSGAVAVAPPVPGDVAASTAALPDAGAAFAVPVAPAPAETSAPERPAGSDGGTPREGPPTGAERDRRAAGTPAGSAGRDTPPAATPGDADRPSVTRSPDAPVSPPVAVEPAPSAPTDTRSGRPMSAPTPAAEAAPAPAAPTPARARTPEHSTRPAAAPAAPVPATEQAETSLPAAAMTAASAVAVAAAVNPPAQTKPVDAAPFQTPAAGAKARRQGGHAVGATPAPADQPVIGVRGVMPIAAVSDQAAPATRWHEALAVEHPGAERRPLETPAPIVLPAAISGLRDGASRLVEIDAPATAGASTLDQVLPTQIVRSIRLQWQAGQGEARVQLRPEYLGDLTVTIKVDQGAVTATLHAETAEVRRWIESHSASLRDGLAEQGLRLDRLIVADDRPRHEATADRRQRQDDAGDDGPERRRRGRPHPPATPFDLPHPDSHERTSA